MPPTEPVRSRALLIQLLRYSSAADDTLGALFVDGQFCCYTLEDEYRAEKVYGETRIPQGTYRVRLQTKGKLHNKYLHRFSDIHRGMLHVENVKGFEGIMFHCGNKDEHTAGCILVGNTSQQNVTEDGFIGGSTDAYRRFYGKVEAALSLDVSVKLIIEDFA